MISDSFKKLKQTTGSATAAQKKKKRKEKEDEWIQRKFIQPYFVILFNFLKTKVNKKFWKQEGRKEKYKRAKIILMTDLSEPV